MTTILPALCIERAGGDVHGVLCDVARLLRTLHLFNPAPITDPCPTLRPPAALGTPTPTRARRGAYRPRGAHTRSRDQQQRAACQVSPPDQQGPIWVPDTYSLGPAQMVLASASCMYSCMSWTPEVSCPVSGFAGPRMNVAHDIRVHVHCCLPVCQTSSSSAVVHAEASMSVQSCGHSPPLDAADRTISLTSGSVLQTPPTSAEVLNALRVTSSLTQLAQAMAREAAGTSTSWGVFRHGMARPRVGLLDRRPKICGGCKAAI
jgi:hypothetical protein